MEKSEQILLEHWLKDESFLNWAQDSNQQDIEHWDSYFSKNLNLLELSEIAKAMCSDIPLSHRPLPKAQIEGAFNTFLNRVNEVEISNEAVTQKISNSNYKILGTVLLLVLLGVAGWWYYQQTTEKTVAIATNMDEVQHLILPDGSEVHLSENSTIKYDKNNPRNVNLDGEAFFVVHKKTEGNKKVKFQVMTKDLVVNVFGTEFNVNTTEGQTTVFLREGKVKLKLANTTLEEIEMEPGNLVKYTKGDTIAEVTKKTTYNKNIIVKQDAILFKDIAFSDVLTTLEEIYNVSFEVKEATLNNRKVTTGLPSENFDLVKELLSNTLSITFELKENNKYLIESKE